MGVQLIELPQLEDEFFQDTRLVDVFLLGPLMVWFAMSAKGMPEWSKWALGLSGVATVVFNGMNYLAVEEDFEDANN